MKDYSSDLFIVGFVDYRDKFGTRHRGGYARKYAIAKDDRCSYDSDEAFLKRNNLIIVTESGYNYDRPRRRGEGNE